MREELCGWYCTRCTVAVVAVSAVAGCQDVTGLNMDTAEQLQVSPITLPASSTTFLLCVYMSTHVSNLHSTDTEIEEETPDILPWAGLEPVP